MTYLIEKNLEKKRIDTVIPILCNEVSRNYALALIENNNVQVNKKFVKPSYRVKIGDEVDIIIPVVESKVQGENISLNILHEDNDIILIDKPKGMVVHPGNGNHEGTLVNALMYSHKDKLSSINGVLRPGIVHRIDKDTSGVIVVAKTDEAHKKLSSAFKVHDITREYIALVDGIVEKDKLKINLPIGRDESNRLRYTVTNKNSKNAVTYITVLKRYYNSNVTLVKATLDTGRTHQIRVHMSYIGHPLIGDTMYGKKKNEFNVLGQMLHAHVLGFVHPKTAKYVEYTCDIHKEFKDVLDLLDKKEGSGKI